MGSADLFANAISAKNIIREFSSIAIDGKFSIVIHSSILAAILGQKINIAFVDESGALKPRIQDRIHRVNANPIRQRKSNLRRSLSSNGGTNNAARRKAGSSGRAKSDVKLKKMSVDDLDKELETYMSSRNAGAN